ncbi:MULTISPECIES: bifunctional UDP-sugar hydrolase/5'-nucleotidase [Virgibacillus]|uniref:bifunctional metallophosphatase/5'-nucleotidase n=1 Tax=Virgibacillus TaxID=84406 RepID=UPI00090A1CC0|nr:MULTISPECIES: bifunctional UDP-sugar hydrolase/5'-nucleotidase [Virgibacillus]API91671.1 bifunctional metallophosphatase/5'-nucleotidase [Virgibacillus sp. 6R]MBS7427781.1 bifunctional metallophosphatase/5'-nucleotidase [Virgibacillus sp. 19R1-5]
MLTLENKPVHLTIVYTSDIHGHIMPINYGTNEEAASGLARYATAVKQIRSTSNNVIVLDNGDLIQGTPLMTYYVKQRATTDINPMIQAMNHIGIDAGVIGNHEFNYGKTILQAAIEQSNFPWLAANVIDVETNEPKYGPPYLIKTIQGGIKVAIIGVTTHYIPNWESPEHISGIRFNDAFETVQSLVPYVRQNEKPDLVVVSYHGGFERDIETGEATEAITGENQGHAMCQIDGIDVLLTGHQHRELTGKINDVLVIQSGNNGSFYGKVDVQFTKSTHGWEVTNKQAHLQSLEHTSPDADILHMTEKLETSTQQWLDQPIGYIKGEMTIDDPFQVRIDKHPFIEFIQKVQMEASGADISVTALLNNTSKGFTSTVTMRDVVANYMYPNTLVVLELQGKDIKAALEKSAAYFTLDESGSIMVNPAFEKPKPQHYNYDMWEGITYTINVAKPIGERVKELRYHGQPISKEGKYHVVLNNYRANGGGDYTMFQNKPVVKEIQKDAVELIRECFERYSTIEATVTKNFKVIAE